MAAVVTPWPWNYDPLEVHGDKYNFIRKEDYISVRKKKKTAETQKWKSYPKAPKSVELPKYRPPRIKRSVQPVSQSNKENHLVENNSKPTETLKRNCACTCEKNDKRNPKAGEIEDNFCHERLSMKNGNFTDLHDRHFKSNWSGFGCREFVNVLSSCEGKDSGDEAMIEFFDNSIRSRVLTSEETVQVLKMLDTGNTKQQIATLEFILEQARCISNAQLLVENGLLEELICIVLMGSSAELQTRAVSCISEVVAREEHSSLWLEPMVISGTEALLGLLSDKGTTHPEKLVRAVLKILINLSKNTKMAFLLIRYGLEDVVKLTACKASNGRYSGNATSRGLAVKFLTHLMVHGEDVASMVLSKYTANLHHIIDILQYDPCQQQQEVLRFLAVTAPFTTGLEVIATHHALEHILWALTCSCCRLVRELASEVVKSIATSDKTLIMSVFEQVCHMSSSLQHSVQQSLLLNQKQQQKHLPVNHGSRKESWMFKDNKMTLSMSNDERTVVSLVSFLSFAFQVDSVQENGRDREFCGPNPSSKWWVINNSQLSEKYSSSLKIHSNVLVTLRNILDAVEHEVVEPEGKERLRLEYAALLVQCGALQCLEQLNFLSKKLLKVNQPSCHIIDPATLPPREVFCSIRNKPLFENGAHKKTYHDYGFNRLELDFVCEILDFLIILSQTTAGSDFNPTIEEVNVFQDSKPKSSKQKRHTSFRKSAVLVKNAIKFTRERASKEKNEEDQPVFSESTRSQLSRSSSSSTATSSLQKKISEVARVERTGNELGADTRDARAMVNFIRQSLLEARVVQGLAPWITCGIREIQDRVLTLIRYLFHQNSFKTLPITSSSHTSPESFSARNKISLSQISACVQPSNNNRRCSTLKKSVEISHLCVRKVIQHCGSYLLDLLSPPASPNLGKSCLMVIKAAVFNGEHDTRLKLVRMGCFASVIDFIRGNDEETVQALGILIVRVLVTSDRSLQQLFVAHGGMNLVMALHEYKEALVKQETAYLLTSFRAAPKPCLRRTRISVHKKRSKRIHPKVKADNEDIWERVMAKWETQDQVHQVLKKFNVRY